jgi:hypothetical protein
MLVKVKAAGLWRSPPRAVPPPVPVAAMPSRALRGLEFDHAGAAWAPVSSGSRRRSRSRSSSPAPRASTMSSPPKTSEGLLVIYMLVVLYAACFQMQSPAEPFLVEKLVGNETNGEWESAYGRLNSFFSFWQFVGECAPLACIRRWVPSRRGTSSCHNQPGGHARSAVRQSRKRWPEVLGIPGISRVWTNEARRDEG